MVRTFHCVPGASIFPAISIFGLIFCGYCGYVCFAEGETGTGFIFAGYSICLIAFLIWCWDRTMWKVQIKPDSVVCSAPFCKDIIIEYNKCTIGVDYHLQGTNKVWWIYLSDGKQPVYESNNPHSRMNSLKCCSGFIRLMYRQEIYDTFVELLPKKQKNALVTAARCAGLVPW